MQISAVQPEDTGLLADLLSRAFAQDPGLRWIIPDEEDWLQISKPYFRLLINRSLRKGLAQTSSDRSCVALWEPPQQTNSLATQLWHLLRVYLLLKGNLNRAVRLQARIDSYRPRFPVWYLAYLATDPDRQGEGLGGKILNPVLELADRSRQSIYLDCSNRENLSFYFGHGFRLLDEVTSPDGPTLWPMIREPA
ncbi:MAG: GNAT family N-acetyltransferase [Pseudomonadales bacterium]|nr:GNAT family N-acetyltransferase [Pseudomonadales bacterium]